MKKCALFVWEMCCKFALFSATSESRLKRAGIAKERSLRYSLRLLHEPTEREASCLIRWERRILSRNNAQLVPRCMIAIEIRLPAAKSWRKTHKSIFLFSASIDCVCVTKCRGRPQLERCSWLTAVVRIFCWCLDFGPVTISTKRCPISKNLALFLHSRLLPLSDSITSSNRSRGGRQARV